MSEKNEWKPIESAPKDGSEIIVFHPQAGVCAAFCPGDGFSWHCMDGMNTGIGKKSGQSIPIMTSFVEPPTHWMPLPAAPGSTSSAPGDAQDERQPLFWYRPCSDDGYEGPLHNDRIEDVRKKSGAWVPLYPGFAALPKPLTDLRYHGEFIRGWNQCLREVSASVPAPAAGDALGDPNDLIERLLDAQQDLNQIANETMSQTLCSVSALLDEIEVALRRQASRPPSAPSGAHAVPAEVKAALDRMCTPLDTSWLTGITAIEDARCMKVILDYIVLGADAATRNAQVIEALRVSLQALEAIGAEMTVGERYTNAGQYLIDALPLARAALAAQVPQQGEA